MARPNGATFARTPVLFAALTVALGAASSARAKGAAPPSVEKIKAAVDGAYSRVRKVTEGKNADYIPALAKVNPNFFGIAVMTVDGQLITAGDADELFSIQSVSKPFIFGRLLTEMTPEEAEKKIGVNATGQPFNSLIAVELNKEEKRPATGNPLVNAGAIGTVALLKAATPTERWTKVSDTLNAFAGRKLTVNQEVYQSESESNGRNKGIAEVLKSYEVFTTDPSAAVDVYTRQCSVSVNAKDLAAMGATLANGGVNPLTHQQVLPAEAAEHVLAVMMTNGLYEDTGSWAYWVGVPAKSGVGGGIVAVVPGQYAIATFSPPLDKAGNSVRGQQAIEQIVKMLGGNLFVSQAAPEKPAPR
jgi:glutaminase